MNDYVTNITLDLNCSKNTPTIDSAQFDKGRVFSVAITADGEPYSVAGCQATLKCVHSDNSCTFLDCTNGISQSGDTVTVTIQEDTLPVRGLTAAKLVFTDGTRNYSTQIFLIDVDSSLDGNVRSEAYSIINKLVDLMTQVHALNESGLIIIDNELKTDSANPVENRVVKSALDEVENNIYHIVDNTLSGDSNSSPSLFVLQTDAGCQLVYDDSDDTRHVLLSLPNFNEMEYASRKVDRISNVNNAQPADSVNYPSVNAVKALLGDGYFTRTESNPTVTAGFAGSGVPIFVSGNTMFSAGACTGNIVTLFVPRTVTKIDGGAFSNCASLTDVYIDNEAKSDDNPNGIEITSGAFGNSVTVHYNAKFNAVTQLIMAIHAGVS